ncbi:MAG: hypothetical protein RLZZ387_5701 [Chloroflexota bacterium]|jgi:hypothetical protein
MKWNITRTYWKIALSLGALASFLMAAGTSSK